MYYMYKLSKNSCLDKFRNESRDHNLSKDFSISKKRTKVALVLLDPRVVRSVIRVNTSVA
jgi:hypothetical protein